MTLKFPSPSSAWSPAYQIRLNQAAEVNDLSNMKKGAVIDPLILRSPNGKRWEITVTDAGALITTVQP